MAKSTVEFDFFRMEKEASSRNLLPRNNFDRGRNIRDIQTAISKINPTILRKVMASGCPSDAAPLIFPQKIEEKIQTPFPRPMDSPPTMTIFYNGTVSVFQVPQERADDILKLAVEKTISGKKQQLVEYLEGDLPIARRKSLQRFLEKRRQRLVSSSSPPYAF